MTVPSPGRIQQRNAASERGRLITPPRKLLDKLQPFSFAEPGLGIRPADAVAFSEVAAATETVILLRSTNPRSLAYVGIKGYTPKAIDCKAKTAKSDDLVDGYAVECAGLVADPRMLSPKVFDGGEAKAVDCWQQFVHDHRVARTNSGAEVFLRSGGKGFYAVDSARPSTICRHHGCLMFSRQEVPSNFDPTASHTRAWMQQHMSYVHGDYDLYGVVDVASIDRRRGTNTQHVHSEMLFDIKNLFTSRTHDVQEQLNAAIGCEMVQHGEQAAYKFSADKIYVFAPNGERWLISQGRSDTEMAGMLADLFRYVFATELA